MPSSIDYVEKPGNLQDQVAMASHSQAQLRSEGNASNARKSSPENHSDNLDRGQEARFGFTNIGSTGTVSSFLR